MSDWRTLSRRICPSSGWAHIERIGCDFFFSLWKRSCHNRLVGFDFGRAAGLRASMRMLVTGSAVHLGEALVNTFKNLNHDVVGIDILESPFTTYVGSIRDRACV